MERMILSMAKHRVLLSAVTLLFLGWHPDHLHAQETNIAASGLRTAILHSDTTTFIDGGTRPGEGAARPNLFHSFGDFSIGEGHTALFRNTDGYGGVTNNIFGRVTGGNLSNIFGTIDSATNFPQANLWLINPAGFLFWPTAALNVGGSVNISTADYLRLNDGARFNALPGSADALLSMEPVAAFGFVGGTPTALDAQTGRITLDGGTVLNGQTLSLVGRDNIVSGDRNPGIEMTGGTLSNAGGRVNLVSVDQPVDPVTGGEVGVSGTGRSLSLTPQNFSSLGEIRVTGRATIDTSSNAAGPIVLRGGHLVIAGNSNIRASTGDGSGGTIDVHVGHAQISEFSGINTDTFGSGRGGDLVISTSLLTLADPGTVISADTHSTSNAGFITVNTGELKLIGSSRISSTSTSLAENAGSAGFITIQGLGVPGSSAASVTLDNSTISTVISGGSAGGTPATIGVTADTIALSDAAIRANTGGQASAGDIIFNTNALTATRSVIDSGTLGPGSQVGHAGSITIRGNQGIANPHDPASTVTLDDTLVITSTFGGGDSGDITITADTLKLQNTAQISAAPFGSGDGGNLIFNVNRLTASNSSILGFSPLIDDSQLGTGGRGGSVTIRGDQGVANHNDSATSVVLDDTFISTGTLGAGDAGTITITAGTLNLRNGTSIFALTFGSGNAGDIALNTNRLTASNSDIASNSTISTKDLVNPGRAGAVAIRGDQGTTNPNDFAMSVVLDKTSLDTATRGAESGGAITLAANTITLRNGANIQADTSGDADAGSITLRANTLTAENATISSGSGRGLDIDGTIVHEVGNGRGGDIRMSADTMTLQKGSVVQTNTAGPGDAGTILLNANTLLAAHATISTRSDGPDPLAAGNAGDITLASAGNLTLRNSTVSTTAVQASGGSIKLTAPNVIFITDSTLTSSVQGQVGSNGGNISIDPIAVAIQNSQILANANAGAGGNINIAASGVVLLAPNNTIDASAGPAGISGTVSVTSPLQVLSGTLVPLKVAYGQPVLSGNRCAADPQGQFSSFVQTGRDGVPRIPGGFAPSPLLPLNRLVSISRGAQGPRLAAARLGLTNMGLEKSTPFRFRSTCGS